MRVQRLYCAIPLFLLLTSSALAGGDESSEDTSETWTLIAISTDSDGDVLSAPDWFVANESSKSRSGEETTDLRLWAEIESERVIEATGPLDSSEACTWMEFTDASDESLDGSLQFLLVREPAARSCAAHSSLFARVDENRTSIYFDPDWEPMLVPAKPSNPQSTGPGIPVVFDHSWSHILDPL